jgi:hypothetical protein
MRFAFTLLVFFFISSAGFSAEIKVGNDEFNKGAIFITGKIEKGDYIKAKEATKNYVNLILKDSDNELKFILNSEGGDVEEAIKIGLLFRKSLSQVYVWGNRLLHESESDAQWILNHRSKGWAEKYETQNSVIYSDKRPVTEQDIKKCYSACVLMLLGGTQKQVSDNHYWIDGFIADESKDIPVIGLHRPYFTKEEYAELGAHEAEAAYKKLEKLVRGYLEEIGATQKLIDRMFKSASNEIDLVNDSEFRNMVNLEEPFYNEWIIARCGVFDDGKGLLSKEDFDYKNSVWDTKKKEVRRLMGLHGGGPEDYSHVYKDYIPDSFSKEKYEKILAVVRSHNIKYRTCKESSVKNHQVELFSE